MKKIIFKNQVKFNDKKLVIAIETPLGIVLNFEYNDKDEMISVNDGHDFIGSYEYSNEGCLNRYSDTDGVEIVYGYDSENYLLALVITSTDGTNQLYTLNSDTLIPIYGLDVGNKETVRIFDECGYLVDYSTMRDTDFYEKSKYTVKKVEDNIIQLEFHSPK